MKHVTFAGRRLLMDDEAADTLVAYARALAGEGLVDQVTLRGIGSHGAEVQATFLLNAAVQLMSETAPGDVTAPANDDAVAYMRRCIDVIELPPPVQPETLDPVEDYLD